MCGGLSFIRERRRPVVNRASSPPREDDIILFPSATLFFLFLAPEVLRQRHGIDVLEFMQYMSRRRKRIATREIDLGKEERSSRRARLFLGDGPGMFLRFLGGALRNINNLPGAGGA